MKYIMMMNYDDELYIENEIKMYVLHANGAK